MDKLMCLTNEVVNIKFEWGTETDHIMQEFISFLSPHFFEQSGLENHFSVIGRLFEKLDPVWNTICKEVISIRKSSKPEFELGGLYGEQEDVVCLIDNKTRTAFVVDKSKRTIEAYVSELSFIHLAELIRYSALLIEEFSGTILLHASAVTNAKGTLLILGEKYAGKTTTLLQLIENYSFSLFSGDKILLRVRENTIWVRGWPDYPHVGLGTLRRHSTLLKKLAINQYGENGNLKDDNEKELIKPSEFRRVIPYDHNPSAIKISGLLFPNISKKRVSLRTNNCIIKISICCNSTDR